MSASPVPPRSVRRRATATLAALALLVGLLAGALAAPGGARADVPPAGQALHADDYWAFIDTIAARLDRRWQPAEQAYGPSRDSYSTAVNAHLLTLHALAALHDHHGPARRDERARLLVRRLTASPAPFRERAPAADRRDKMFHAPGWVNSLTDPRAGQDKAIDPKVAEALAHAWRAAAQLGLSEQDKALIVDRIDRTARGRFFRFPNVRLNQINWNADLYALDAELTGSTDLLRRDYREHVMRFVRFATRPVARGASANLASSYRFIYLPHERPSHP